MWLEKRPFTCHSNILRNLFVKFTEVTMIIMIPRDWCGSVILFWSRNKIIVSIKVQLQCKLIHFGSKSQSQSFQNKNKKKAIMFFIGSFSIIFKLLFYSKLFLFWFFCTHEFASGWMNPGLTSLLRWSLLCLCVLSMMMSVVVVLIIVPNSRGDSILRYNSFCKCPHTGCSFRL